MKGQHKGESEAMNVVVVVARGAMRGTCNIYIYFKEVAGKENTIITDKHP